MKPFRSSALFGSVSRALLAGALTAAACGDDGPPQLTTGVAPDKPIGTVTPDEAQQICTSTEAWAKRAIAEAKQRELTCRIAALSLAAGASLSTGGARRRHHRRRHG